MCHSDLAGMQRCAVSNEQDFEIGLQCQMTTGGMLSSGMLTNVKQLLRKSYKKPEAP